LKNLPLDACFFNEFKYVHKLPHEDINPHRLKTGKDVLELEMVQMFRPTRRRSKYSFIDFCCNLSLGLATKARACKVASQEGSPKVRPHAPKSARECEGIDLHTPKGTPTLGVGISVDSRMFKKQLQGPKPNGLKSFLYY
jgi:hypothetical protein